MGNCPKGDNDFQARHGSKFRLEVVVALANFSGRRLVGGWQATDGIGNPAVCQRHGRIRLVVGIQRLGSAGEAKAVQRRIEQLAGYVTGERSAGTVGPLFARAEADHQQLGIQRTKGGNRKRMPVRVTTTNAGQVFGQSGAGSAVLWIVK